jgi:hypothetical protein
MQGPTDEAEASIPEETLSNGPNLNPNTYRTVTVHRKAAKRILPWDLPTDEIQPVLPRPQDEDIPARKKQRLDESLHTTTDEAARKTASPDVRVGFPSPAADHDDANASTLCRSSRQKIQLPPIGPKEEQLDDDDDANADPVTDTQPSAAASRTPRRLWKEEEDAKLKEAVKKHGKDCWAVVAVLVPGRTSDQCRQRWVDVLDAHKISTMTDSHGDDESSSGNSVDKMIKPLYTILTKLIQETVKLKEETIELRKEIRKDNTELNETVTELKTMVGHMVAERMEENEEETAESIEPDKKKSRNNMRRCKKCWRPYADERWKKCHEGATTAPEKYCTNTTDKHPKYDETMRMPRWERLATEDK